MTQLVARLAGNSQCLNSKESGSRYGFHKTRKEYDKKRSSEKVVKYWWGLQRLQI